MIQSFEKRMLIEEYPTRHLCLALPKIENTTYASRIRYEHKMVL
jgi:hypothetical protein